MNKTPIYNAQYTTHLEFFANIIVCENMSQGDGKNTWKSDFVYVLF
jgi:hypothetical protein